MWICWNPLWKIIEKQCVCCDRHVMCSWNHKELRKPSRNLLNLGRFGVEHFHEEKMEENERTKEPKNQQHPPQKETSNNQHQHYSQQSVQYISWLQKKLPNIPILGRSSFWCTSFVVIFLNFPVKALVHCLGWCHIMSWFYKMVYYYISGILMAYNIVVI